MNLGLGKRTFLHLDNEVYLDHEVYCFIIHLEVNSKHLDNGRDDFRSLLPSLPFLRVSGSTPPKHRHQRCVSPKGCVFIWPPNLCSITYQDIGVYVHKHSLSHFLTELPACPASFRKRIGLNSKFYLPIDSFPVKKKNMGVPQIGEPTCISFAA